MSPPMLRAVSAAGQFPAGNARPFDDFPFTVPSLLMNEMRLGEENSGA